MSSLPAPQAKRNQLPATTAGGKTIAKDGTTRGLKHAKYSEEKHLEIVASVREGRTKTMSFRLAGIHPDTVFDWIHKGREDPEQYPHYAQFADDVDHAKALAEADALDDIKAAGKADSRNWGARAWYLERTNPKEFGKHDKVSVEDERPPVQINLNQIVLENVEARTLSRALLRRTSGLSPHEPLGLGVGDEPAEEGSIEA